MPTGRISNIKKTYILRSSAIICIISALLFIFLSFFFNNSNNEWFYIFCLFCGAHQMIRGILLNVDSSSYMGSSLVFIGVLRLFAIYLNIPYASTVYFIAFALSSLYIFIVYSSVAHLILSFAFTYEAVIYLLFLSNKINLTKFLVFNSILFFIFLVICAIIFIKIKKTRRKDV